MSIVQRNIAPALREAMRAPSAPAMVAESAAPLLIEIVGVNPTRFWGLEIVERTRRIARSLDLGFARSPGKGPHAGPRLLVNATFAADPAWLRHAAAVPGFTLTWGGVPALAHCRGEAEAAPVREAMSAGAPYAPAGALAFEDGPTVEDKLLRKRATPFLAPLTPENVPALERASYFGAYKGVTDILTKYLWPLWALALTRVAARIGMTPNMVTALGAALCVSATFAFADGRYWLGMALGLAFMVLDTVDGKLARCTITSSWWGNVFDHGVDLVHPPFWWWFWGVGLAKWGLALPHDTFMRVMAAIVGGYVVQRMIEGAFMRRFGGMHIHVWERFDSRFRLITARRNPNMVILFVSLIFGRPDIGLIAVAWWTVLSCAVHAVRLLQAMLQARSGRPVTSWLAAA